MVYEVQKNAQETLRAELSEFRGHKLFSLRCYVQNPKGGELIPTRKGVTVQIAVLPEIKKAVDLAVAEAQKLGLLTEPGEVEDAEGTG